jgi:Tfp pilus assembly protein PilZ
LSHVEAAPRVESWCKLCGVEHSPEASCPRQIQATGPEKTRWRVVAQTDRGIEGFGVLMAEAGTRWRARIVTFPKILWTIPGGGETMKFLDRSETECLRRAVDYLRSHCIARGFLMRDELQVVKARRRSAVVGAPVPKTGGSAPRYDRKLPVMFGRNRPTIPAFTANMSETGLFVATRTPLCDGELAGLTLELEDSKVPLRGAVAWNSVRRDAIERAGMGMRLVNPPSVYREYVRALG